MVMKSCEFLGWELLSVLVRFQRAAHCLAHLELSEDLPGTALYFILEWKYHGYHHQSPERRLLTPPLRRLSRLPLIQLSPLLPPPTQTTKTTWTLKTQPPFGSESHVFRSALCRRKPFPPPPLLQRY